MEPGKEAVVPVLAVADALAVIVPAAAALLGVALGQLLPHFFEGRRSARARYDAAIAAVTRAEANRWGTNMAIDPEHMGGDATRARALSAELSEDSIKRWTESQHEARIALAALHPWSPDLQSYWNRFEVTTPAEAQDLLDLLMERAKKPTKRYAGRAQLAKPADEQT
jgi:hypothetical protein